MVRLAPSGAAASSVDVLFAHDKALFGIRALTVQSVRHRNPAAFTVTWSLSGSRGGARWS